ncbi:SAVED domain-containing protein [Actinospica robiniae]|uniref:SAVED domain-containing protein n=1 Tax=Actinospica robiniae TaxID=304901 RepID=UPI0003F5A4CA|nr:SAVED domain-containing protein [Actinospica robiniae]
MTGVLPTPSRSGVRIAGDMYQWLIVWHGCVTVLRDHVIRPAKPVIGVGVEVDGVGNLDDVILYHQKPPHTYGQVKYAVGSSTPVNEAYLLAPGPTGGPSILAKVATAWRDLTADGSVVDLALISNRVPDAADLLVRDRDPRTQLLLPRAAQSGPRSGRGQARQRWADGAGLSIEKLMELLAVLRFDIGRDPAHLRELVQHLMVAAGLRHEDPAIDAGADWVARMVRDGHRKLTLDLIEKAVKDLELATGPARAVLSIATLKPDPMAAEADWSLEWTDRFDGASAYAKRRPKAPATWEQLQSDIEDAPRHLPGATNIAVTGSLRQATAFLTGSAFRMVTGADLAVLQRGQVWSTSASYEAAADPVITRHNLGQGPDLAVAIAVATDPTADVLDYLRAHGLPVDALLVIAPPVGAKDNAVPDASSANALAVVIRDTVRRAARTAPHVHLFLAGPMGLALLLGHRWNRVCPTTVYEDVAAADIYEPAFTIDA